MFYRYLVIFLFFGGSQVYADAGNLGVKQIRKDLAAEIVDIEVIELHESTSDKITTVTYTGIPLESLLQYLYPREWKEFDGEVHFHALDGYLSIVDAEKARQGTAYMAFARADGKPFVIDNNHQQEHDVPLGPFYLVWDNVKNQGQQESNSYAWPYQVYRVALVSDAMLLKLQPVAASPSVEAGFDAYKDNCLSCHNINGFGGKKFGMDLREAIKGRSRSDLRDWIDNPVAINRFTAMPPLDPGITGENRERVINQIIDYLQAN
jgi:mono/diheme cytochrome c family protein